MSNHFTEDELQQYIDGTLSTVFTQKIEEHLKICQNCRKAFNRYSNLYHLLEKNVGFELPVDFSKKVMDLLPQPENKNIFSKFREFFWTILAFLVGFGISYYFTDIKFFNWSLPKLTSPKIQFDLSWLKEIQTDISNINMSLFLCILLIIVLSSIFDSIIFKKKLTFKE